MPKPFEGKLFKLKQNFPFVQMLEILFAKPHLTITLLGFKTFFEYLFRVSEMIFVLLFPESM